MAERVRVLVVDDSSTTRTMLREALALDGDIVVVGEADSGAAAVAVTESLQPDVVLMDVRMPGGGGVEAAREISERSPATKIVALTWSDDATTVRDMLAAGAIGYVVKGGTIDELSSAIRRARHGETDLDQRVLPAAMEDLRRLLDQETQRREEAERLATAREEFVQVLSHELRTPLTVISGALRMLQRSGVGAEVMPLLESAIRRAGELEFMIEGLELTGSPAAAPGAADPGGALQRAIDRLGDKPDEADVAREPWPGVPQQSLDRVMVDLLSNALQHGRRPIEVTARLENGEGILQVRDAGGWTASAAHFSPFSQGDMSETRTRNGFGLGLYVAHRLCQACHGRLEVRAVEGVTVAEARFRTTA